MFEVDELKEKKELLKRGLRLIPYCPVCVRPVLDMKKILEQIKQGKGIRDAILSQEGIASFGIFVPTSSEILKLTGNKNVVYPVCVECEKDYISALKSGYVDESIITVLKLNLPSIRIR